MNTLIKRAMIVAGITTAMALPLSSQASDGTITFTGGVTANTCTVKVNGATADETVTLPTVSVNALDNTSTKTAAAGTFFHIDVSACPLAAVDVGPTLHAPTTVKVYFEAGPNVDQKTGGLINLAASGSNVEVNLYNASSASKVTTQVTPGVLPNSVNNIDLSAGGSEYFYAGYSTLASGGVAATAGLVSTSVTYSLIYQ